MNEIILYKRDGYYWSSNSTPQLETMSDFFTSDVTLDISSWKDYALDNSIQFFGGNVSILEKEGDYITVGDEWHYDDDPRVDATTMLISDFVIMLERWDELYKQKPDEIIITQDDNGKISMVGKFNDGREI